MIILQYYFRERYKEENLNYEDVLSELQNNFRSTLNILKLLAISIIIFFLYKINVLQTDDITKDL